MKDFVIQALFTTWFLTQHVAPEDIYYKPSFLAARPAGRPAIAKLPSSTAYHPKTSATFPPKTDKLYDRSDTYATTGVKPYKRSLTNYKYGTGMYINIHYLISKQPSVSCERACIHVRTTARVQYVFVKNLTLVCEYVHVGYFLACDLQLQF